MTIRILFATLGSLFCGVALSQPVFAAYGISLDGQLKYHQDFRQFDYTAAEAVKNGKIVLHDIGGFDKLNPFTLKGEAPLGIASLVFEPLAEASLDEPFSQYGLIAEDIAPAEDGRFVTFTLHPQATFADGSPILAIDVGSTLDYLKSDKVHPHYNYYYEDIADYEIVDERRIRVNFKKVNRELPLIAAQIPVISHKYLGMTEENGDRQAGGFSLPMGSGPYTVSAMQPGSFITYRRNPDYWAAEHPVRTGRYNFDEITVKYYKDQTVALEAFKAGEFDFISINIAKQWARDMSGGKFAGKEIVKELFAHHNNAGIQGFVMNTRRQLFADRRVRQALGLALDFEWTNRSLFYNQYVRNDSYFSNSQYAARGLPAGLELQLLEKHRPSLPPEVFTTPLSAPRTDGRGGLRNNLLEAQKLLAEAGWQITNSVLIDNQGREFRFEILLASPSFERVMAAYAKNLKKLGIVASYRTLDTALYIDRVKRFDFDMIVATYGQSQSPGNEQRNYWHSMAAQRTGSSNYPGIASPIVDELVEKVIYATNREELVAACRALDRVLWYGYYLVPNWYLDAHRLSYHNIFSRPTELPLYYDPFQLLMTWWMAP